MVEVPSHTLELFASDPRVLSLIGSGSQGAARALSPEALQQAEGARRGRFAALYQQPPVGRGGGSAGGGMGGVGSRGPAFGLASVCGSGSRRSHGG